MLDHDTPSVLICTVALQSLPLLTTLKSYWNSTYYYHQLLIYQVTRIHEDDFSSFCNKVGAFLLVMFSNIEVCTYVVSECAAL